MSGEQDDAILRAEDPTEARRLRVLLDHLPALVGYWDRDQRNVIANRAYLEWFGVTPQQIRGVHMREVLGEELYSRNREHVEGVLSGEEQQFRRELITPEGDVRQAQATYVPDVVDGEVQGFFVLVTDITAQVQAQHALVEAQHLAGVGSWEYQVEPERVTWSPETYRIAGVDPDTFVPSLERVLRLVHPDDLDRALARLRTIRDDGEPYDLDYRLVRPDGAVREIHTRGRAHRAPDGTVVRLSGTWQDVTTRNEHTRRLVQLNTELSRANQLNSDILGMFGHDIRQPMAIVLGFLDVVSERWDRIPDEQRRAHVERALGAARRTATMLDDVLAVASSESGSIASWPRPVEVAAVVREVVDAEARHTAIEVRSTGDPWALVDPFQLQQIVANLLSNATRYGEPPVEVEVSRRGGTVLVSVSDHGPGVPPDFVESLFDRFERASTGVAAERAGTGFGLYLVQRLALANGGRVGYSDRQPHGACFTVTLPAAPTPHPDESGASPDER